MGQLLRRLERRGRPQNAQSPPDPKTSRKIPAANARSNSNKKSTGTRGITAAIRAWEEAKPAKNSNATIAARELQGEIEAQGQLTETVINNLISRWRAKFKPATVHTRRAQVMSLLAMLVRAGLADWRIRDHVAKVPAPNARTVTAERETIANLKAAAKPWMRAFICLCVDCGLRFSEAHTLVNANYDTARKIITFRTKGGAIHAMPVLDELAQLIDATPYGGPTENILTRIRGGDPHTPRIIRGGQISSRTIRSTWEKLKAAVGAPRELRPHDLRRTMAANIYSRTHDLRIAQQALGHAALSSTLHYLGAQDPNKLRPLLEELTSVYRYKN